MTPEEARVRVARSMFEFLVRRDAWLGCRDWDSLDPKIQDNFTDMAALYTENRQETTASANEG